MNSPSSLENLLEQGESQTLEFKRSLRLRREGLKALCAMVNANSAFGIVIFGVENNGSVCGIEQGNLDQAQRSLSQAIDSGFDPSIDYLDWSNWPKVIRKANLFFNRA